MVLVPAGNYIIGRNDGDELERPQYSVELKPFYIDRTEVTNADYKKFVDQTGHAAPLGWTDGNYPAGRDLWPVVNVSWQDAVDYATWSGKRLPTEEEWEAAARGSEGRVYPWGDRWNRNLANIDSKSISDVGQHADGASPFGALDMIGNVWEWTADWYSPKHEADAPKACCVPENPHGGAEAGSYDPRQPQIRIPRKVLKGGSHLCAPNYCRRYRPAARHAQPIDSSTSHIGFRCVVRKSTKS
jgi:formylglycine-generating enzyme required for sulfatase activity